MAKWYISCDFEGIMGVVSYRQCEPSDSTADQRLYREALDNQMLELNYAINAIKRCDRKAEITVNDAHSTMLNIDQGDLPGEVTLVSGKPKIAAMMSGLDATFDAVVLMGYHAKAGTAGGVLNHTYHHMIADVQVNGTSYGEAGLNSLYAHLVHHVPVVLGAGDQAFCHELLSLLPDIQTVETKKGISTTAAECHPPDIIEHAYKDAFKLAMNRQSEWDGYLREFSMKKPFTVTLQLKDTMATDAALLNPAYMRVDGTTIGFSSDDFQIAYRQLQTAYTLIRSAMTV